MFHQARFGPVAPFRLLRLLILGAVAVVALTVIGRAAAAIGIGLGIALFCLNLFLLHEIGRSLVPTRARRTASMIAAGSIAGRFVLLAVALGLIAVYLGRETLLGACGGLLLSQVHLHFLLKRPTEAV
jgi:hypothetical protein